MLLETNLAGWDWIVIVLFLSAVVAISLYFTRRAGKDIQSFFISGRSLPWYIAGVSIIATNFASDTPLWVSSLVRQYGIYTVWQYWAPLIGGSLCAVLFARFWRRMNVVTDIEFLELRYSGRYASILRFWLGSVGAMVFCPLIISWVTKAMVTIADEAMGIPKDYQYLTTLIVLAVAMLTCAFSGLYGVVYTDLIQFIIATIGTVTLAVLSVKEVGGLDAMIVKLRGMSEWSGNSLNFAPTIGSSEQGKMSFWNILGYFAFLWMGNAVSARFVTQRLLACKNSKHATYAQLLYSAVYWGILAWPWIIVALCSLIIFPDMTSHDHAYPRMIIHILPLGLRGMLVAALLAAFISTINTLFNWGSSYIVNDVYKRFILRDASDRHYVWIGRSATVFLALMGGYISTLSKNIQELLEVFYVVGVSLAVVELLRWMWPRLNAIGELVASITAWTGTILLVFGAFNPLAAAVLKLPDDIKFNKAYDLLGARMLFMLIITLTAAVIGSLSTKPTEPHILANFVKRALPLRIFWRSVIRQNNIDYQPVETLSRTLVSWLLVLICIIGLQTGLGKLLLGEPLLGLVCLAAAAVALILTIHRAQQDHAKEQLIIPSDSKSD